MLRKKTKNKPSIIVVMPAYNAARMLERTYDDIPKDIISETILVDDKSTDNTVVIAQRLGITVITHVKNLGYGGNQKTCYQHALVKKADIVVMIHPDYQYDATLIGQLVAPIVEKRFDMMFGSRIRTRSEALNGGMPLEKYILNRIFCILENIVLGANFTEYFSGMRAYSKELLQKLPLASFSNDFVFDQQMMLAAYVAGFRIGEINTPVRYFSESSSIGNLKGMKYLVQTMMLLVQYVLFRLSIYSNQLFIIPKNKKV